MGFSVLLVLIGFVSEYLQGSKAEDKLDETASALSALQAKNDRIEDRLSIAREVLSILIEQKQGKVARLEQIDPSEPYYFSPVREIQNDLHSIDTQLEEAIDGLAVPTEEQPSTGFNAGAPLGYAAVD